MFVVCGTTGGDVTIWDLAPLFGEQRSAKLVTTYTAHSMGTNCITAVILPNRQGLKNDDVMIRVCSGGDDEAIAVAHVFVNDDVIVESGGGVVMSTSGRDDSKFAIDEDDDSTKPLTGPFNGSHACVDVVQGASTSAIKGLTFLRSACSGRFLVSVGYDQRVTLWQVLEKQNQFQGGHLLPQQQHNEVIHSTLATTASLRWLSVCVVDVTDVSGIEAVSHYAVREDDPGGEEQSFSSESGKVVVTGMGLQVVSFAVPPLF
uniref:Uncharacterized protein n=1 Tax=Octactis speculum TaxID=3111310 RepID=A0A7S2DBW2_9STRA|mmetsp:Transcript_4558/g.5443  ORF Transcript_4558/g.5443 Transcript_4558/m.5443 type:complete len:260 (+) Transcript_4558:562-1341(+)